MPAHLGQMTVPINVLPPGSSFPVVDIAGEKVKMCGFPRGGLTVSGDTSPRWHRQGGRQQHAGYSGTVKAQLKLGAEVRAVVITVSDRCARGERPDVSGPAAVDALAAAGIPCGAARVVPDGAESVTAAIAAALADGARLV